MNRLLVNLGVLAWLCLPSAASAAQTPYRVFVAPLTVIPPSNSGPTRHEYVLLFGQRDECAGIVPTSREDRADFTVWFDYEGVHSMLLWDADGDLVSERWGVRQGHNIVKDACDAIRKHVAE